jgi:hypothetical protein
VHVQTHVRTCRWYGTEVKTVYVERKTHLDAWTGNVSVKERFTLEERLTVPFLNGSYTVNEYADDMKRRGKKDAGMLTNEVELMMLSLSMFVCACLFLLHCLPLPSLCDTVRTYGHKDIQEACKLFSQIARVIQSKQLGPTVRTQYMRTAFQIPFDSTVRISLDTNLAMVREDCCGYASAITERWRRDERIPVKACEHTHFPHAILEVKLQGDVENPPRWVKDMISSGMVTEVYKFSKFIHGSAVLLTELVAAAPYWIDDVSIRDSVNNSAPTSVNQARSTNIGQETSTRSARRQDDDAMTFTSISDAKIPAPGAMPTSDEIDVTHPLLGQNMLAKRKVQQTDFLGRNGGASGGEEECSCCGLMSGVFELSSCLFARNWLLFHGMHLHPHIFTKSYVHTCPCSIARTGAKKLPRKVPVRVEPKTYFANERTFLSWVNMSVTLGSISSALTVFAAVPICFIIILVLGPVSTPRHAKHPLIESGSGGDLCYGVWSMTEMYCST